MAMIQKMRHTEIWNRIVSYFFQNTYKKIPILFPRCTPEK